MTGAEAVRKWSTIRISGETKSVLSGMALERGITQGAVVSVALERLRRQEVLDAANEAYAAIRKDPEASRKFDEEVAAWDVTLGDGLGDV